MIAKLLIIFCRFFRCHLDSDCGNRKNTPSNSIVERKKKYNKRDSVVDEIEMVLDD
jgi:hypothetical protein